MSQNFDIVPYSLSHINHTKCTHIFSKPLTQVKGSYLDGVGVVGGVLEEAVVGVEHLSGDEEEELPTRTA